VNAPTAVELGHSQIPRSRGRDLLAFIVAAAALTSCHATAGVFRAGPAVGPMNQPGGRAEYCIPRDGEANYVLGFEELTDTGDHHLVLDSASLDGASNLTETGAYATVLKPDQGGLLGVVPGIPPRFFGKGQASTWADRRPLAGTLIPPRSSPGYVNLLVVVHSPDPGADGSVKHLVVRYHSGRQQYVYTGNVEYVLAGTKCHDPRWAR
jgi:hypothetical protein